MPKSETSSIWVDFDCYESDALHFSRYAYYYVVVPGNVQFQSDAGDIATIKSWRQWVGYFTNILVEISTVERPREIPNHQPSRQVFDNDDPWAT